MLYFSLSWGVPGCDVKQSEGVGSRAGHRTPTRAKQTLWAMETAVAYSISYQLPSLLKDGG